MRTLPQRKLTRTLIVCCLALTAVIALEIRHPTETPEPNDGPAESRNVVPASTSLPQFTARPLAELDQILSRPLFFEDRRLPVAPEAPESRQLEPLRLTLEGVAIGGGSRVAVLHDERERVQIRLAEGMTHNGWVLESVKSAGAEFRRGADITKLELEVGEDTRRRRR